MTDLVAAIRAAIGETERIAQAVADDEWRPDVTEFYGQRYTSVHTHIARQDPAAVLRRCAADRKILNLHAIIWRDISWLTDGDEEYAEVPVCERCVPKHSGFGSRAEVPEGACPTVLALAEAYGVEA